MRFALIGSSSALGYDVFPPIDLSDGEYGIGLEQMIVYNTIPNIELNKNDRFYFGNPLKFVTLSEGTYEITDIQDSIIKLVKDVSNIELVEKKDEKIQLQPEKNFKLTLKPISITSRTELNCSEPIDFTKPDSFGSLLGFGSVNLTPNKWHHSDNTANIFPVNVVRVVCNVASGSFRGGIESHSIHDFFPLVGAGFRIVERPQPVALLTVNTPRLTHISVRIEDQKGNLVNFRNEEIIITLRLKKL